MYRRKCDKYYNRSVYLYFYRIISHYNKGEGMEFSKAKFEIISLLLTHQEMLQQNLDGNFPLTGKKGGSKYLHVISVM